jgi:hypothetical protein
MHPKTPHRQPQNDPQIPTPKRRRMEYLLHKPYIDQRQLRYERDRHGGDEHFVLEERAAEPARLDGGGEVQKDETCECLGLDGLANEDEDEEKISS